ncbi:MAG TPA: dTDP-glucose 4,6-dehydratase [Bacillota bacterium]
MGRRILVTGGAGFIGSNFIHYWHTKYPSDWIINLDKLTHTGKLENLSDIQLEARHHFVKGDISDQGIVGKIMVSGVDWIVNFATEPYVDHCITAPSDFVKTNTLGTQNLLEYAKAYGVKRFLQVSTAAVYGSLGPEGYFTETTPPAPDNPYLASKIGADLLALAYYHAYGLPVLVTRCSANYGFYQDPGKLVPMLIIKALNDEMLPLEGTGLKIRDWVFVRDHCRALELVLNYGRAGEVYNIGGHNERTDLEVAKAILARLEKAQSLIFFDAERLGNKRRCVVSTRKIETELGWQPQTSFETGLAATIRWYQTNRHWWQEQGRVKELNCTG